jgi:hypothetical protein
MFALDEFGWWLAKLLIDSNMVELFEQKVRSKEGLQEETLFRIVLGLIHLGKEKTHAMGLLHIQGSLQYLNSRLNEYIGKMLCCGAYNEIKKIGKDPGRLYQAQEFLRQAKEVWERLP